MGRRDTVLGCILTSPSISNTASVSLLLQCLSPSTFLYVPECQPHFQWHHSQPLQQPLVVASHLRPRSSPMPHLTMMLPRFTLYYLVGELCFLVAHLSEAVEAVAYLWKGLNTTASFP